MPEAVVVIEDDPYVRRGIVAQIKRDPAFEVVAEAADVGAARAAIESGRASLGVFDLQLRDGTTHALIPLAVERGIAVLVLTVWDDDENVYNALAAGAGGYLLKGDASAGRVSEALHTLKDGGAPISPMIARRLLDDLRLRPARAAATEASSAAVAPSPSADLSSLTEREREIIELFAKGSTYDEVAAMLEMSVNTVRHHVRSMYRKLHVCSKAEAVTVAYRLT
ncbi:MAG: response regulator transcription factor [Deltaproteobacteria bacterium]|nr:response regulator transcription factor [Deltaproteobacteria bacterium]